MPQIRKNPLPAGRYWVWIASNKEPVWLALRIKNADLLKVESEAATHEGYGWNEYRSGTTYIFTLSGPMIWPAGIGFANTAGADTTTADTVQRGQVPTLSEDLQELERKASELVTEATTTTLIIIGIVLWVASQRRG
jgi:hypothetical protein